jgi:hypothetical protein
MKISTGTLAYCLASFFAAMNFTCSPNLAGNSSQSGNGTVMGMLVQSDGETPATGVSVTIHPRGILPSTDSNWTVFNSVGQYKSDTTVSDNAGKFKFDSSVVDTGLYVIEATKAEFGACIMDSVYVHRDSATEVKDTLRAPGAIRGTIYLSEGGAPNDVYIMAFGINRFAVPDSSGHFCFAPLSQGSYDLRIVTSLKMYGVVNIPQVRVNAADTADLDTIKLPFTSTPRPKNLTATLDVPAQSVILQWERLHSALVEGYRIYRKEVNSDYVKISTNLVVDTFYVDSSTVPFSSYTYRITAVDKANKESEQSTAVLVNTDSFLAFERQPLLDFNTALLQGYRFYDLDSDNDQDLLVAINDADNGPSILWYENNNGMFVQHAVADSVRSFRWAYWPTGGFINPDGSMDILAILEKPQNQSWLFWFKNNGMQEFTAIPIDSLDAFCTDISIARIKDSYSSNILLTINTTNRCIWYEYQGDSSFLRHVIPVRDGDGQKTLVADFDRDGDNDVFALYFYAEKAYWYENKGDTAFTEHQIDNAIQMGDGAQTVDFHGDKSIDIVALSSTKALFLYSNDGFGNFTEKIIVDDSIINFISADLSGDGAKDLVVNRFAKGLLVVAWYQNTTQGFKLHPITPDGVEEYLIDVVDVNGDGLLEIVTRDKQINNKIYRYQIRSP